MWTYPEDRTAGVITAAAQCRSEHGDAGCPRLPETAVLFYMHSGPAYLQQTRPCRLLLEKLPRFLQGGPVYGLGDALCFLDGGRGAPQAVDTLETLAALGVRRVFTVGMCGSFSDQVRVGDILTPSRAIVEEGTSLHYYPAISEARPDPALLHALSAIPGAKPLPIVSCDAVYRQTFFKEQLWREQGAVAVDMETSALFSVGAYLGLPVAAALMVSDCHPRCEGDSPWSWEMTPALREQLFEAVITAILSIE